MRRLDRLDSQAHEYPTFTGAAHECGRGPGLGFNKNIPLSARSTGIDEYRHALRIAIHRILEFRPSALVVAFGGTRSSGSRGVDGGRWMLFHLG